MFSNEDLIDSTIANLAIQPAIFSVADVAAHADLAGNDAAIELALSAHCDRQVVLSLSKWAGSLRGYRHYLGKAVVERWWFERTLRWANAGVDWMGPAQLAGEMGLAFDTRRWSALPDTLMDVGRQWAMVSNGYSPGTFVFPWATAIRCNPQLSDGLRTVVSDGLDDYQAIIEDVLRTLLEREADVLKRRNGLDGDKAETLAEIGTVYGVSRERIRQIEQKALGKLNHRTRQQSLAYAFAADFILTGASLIVAESEMTPHRKFLYRSIGLTTTPVPELGLTFIATEDSISPYRNLLGNMDRYLSVTHRGGPCFPAIGELAFLSKSDGVQLSNAEGTYRYQQVTQSRLRMVQESLRSLNRAAHFEEITIVCNKMFPEEWTSSRNWHAAMGRPDAESAGIVWIGRKGMYGLKEHGYERPGTDLFEEVTIIVEDIFAKTQRSVGIDVVTEELGKKRRELHPISVAMALDLNDRIEAVGHGEYVPKGFEFGSAPDSEYQQYDISAAFEAFSSTADDAEK